MRKKKIFLITIASFLLLVCSFGATYAYLYVKSQTVNEFTVGENTIEVHEDYKPPEKLEPGVSFKKEPYVENTGNVSCFVRMRADFSDSKAKDFCKDLDIDTNYWIKDDSDGYYYYNQFLKPGEKTKSLFTTVRIKEDAKDLDMIDFDILIYAESCQHKDHDGACSDVEYKTVWKKQTESDGNDG